MLKILKQLLDWLYQRNCYICKSPCNKGLVCNICSEQLEHPAIIFVKQINGLKSYSAGYYENNLKKLIIAMKFYKKKELDVNLAEFLFDYWKKLDFDNEDFEIVPVPIHKNKLKQRKYNQMELVAREFSQLTGYSINSAILKRIKDTRPQYELSKKDREINIKGAFEVDKTKYNGKKLLLIDDILTSGSTLKEITDIFYKEGIKNLAILVISSPRS